MVRGSYNLNKLINAVLPIVHVKIAFSTPMSLSYEEIKFASNI